MLELLIVVVLLLWFIGYLVLHAFPASLVAPISSTYCSLSCLS